MAVSQEMLQILACPGCHGTLIDKGEHLVCSACALRFPVREGIPVLLLDQAEPGER